MGAAAATTAGAALVLSMVSLGAAFPAEVRAAAAVYTVVFDATWSEETHPDDFPGNPHFSGLIGGTHAGGVTFWEVGELASLGIQRMAEWGSKAELEDEVEAAIAAGDADAVLSGGAVNPSPGSTALTFAVDEDFSLVALVCMVAPSPDWFVGVSGLDLRAGSTWLPEVTVVLWPYDAGTDSGVSYDAPDQPTNPHEPIALIVDGPLGNGVPLGTFTFSLDEEVSDVPEAALFSLSNAPNPFNPATSIVFDLPRAGRIRLEVFDLAGRRVATLLDEPRDPGRHAVSFAPRDLASGTYVTVLQTGDRRLSRKMTLLE